MKFNKKALALISICFTLLLCEIVLRCLGYRPGVFRKLDGFEVVDSLVVYQNFTTDEAGIYKFSPWVSDSVWRYFNCQTGTITKPEIDAGLYPVDDVEYIYQSFCRLSNTNAANSIFWRITRWYEENSDASEFVHRYSSIAQSKSDTIDEWREAFMEYTTHPYNQDGFRSIAFKPYHTKRTKVLLIGDSFVYGMTARPHYNCFADILLARGYLLYSAGIPGTDPAQYAAIAQKYIPLLKPDVVILCFYEGNDYMHYPRIPSANQPHEHITNAGFFSCTPYGVYLNPQQAYTYYKSLVTIPDIASNRFNNFCSHTALGGLLWSVAYKLKRVEHPSLAMYDSFQINQQIDIPFTASRINIVDSCCRAQQVAFLKIIIPENSATYNDTPQFLTINTKLANKVFAKTSYLYPGNLNREKDFEKDGYHFNNTGSFKFANYLDSLLQIGFYKYISMPRTEPCLN